MCELFFPVASVRGLQWPELDAVGGRESWVSVVPHFGLVQLSDALSGSRGQRECVEFALDPLFSHFVTLESFQLCLGSALPFAGFRGPLVASELRPSVPSIDRRTSRESCQSKRSPNVWRW